MDALQCLCNRRSVRHYIDRPVADEHVAAIVEAGREAPTARNVQPWHFVTVTDPARRRELKQLCPNNGPFIDTAGLAVLVVCDDEKYFLEDGCAAATQMLLAAHAVGLGGCWIAGHGKDYAAEVVRWAGFPGDKKLVAILAIGHPAAPPAGLAKKPLDEIWHKEKL